MSHLGHLVHINRAVAITYNKKRKHPAHVIYNSSKGAYLSFMIQT